MPQKYIIVGSNGRGVQRVPVMADFTALTANRALMSDASGVISVHSTVSDIELGYLNNATSEIQTQINTKGVAPISLICSANYTRTGTTYGTITGMSASVPVGTYEYRAHINCAATATGGIKIQISGPTYTHVRRANGYAGSAMLAGANGTSSVLLADTSAILSIIVEGLLVVTGSGTLIVEAAKNAAAGADLTVNQNSSMILWKVA